MKILKAPLNLIFVKECGCGTLLEVSPTDVTYDDGGHNPHFKCPTCGCTVRFEPSEASKEFLWKVELHNGIL